MKQMCYSLDSIGYARGKAAGGNPHEIATTVFQNKEKI